VIRSMTGFGRAAFELDGVPFEVEIRTVNHRHLDVRIRLPRILSESESGLKARVQAKLKRGKVDASIQTATGAASPPTLELDQAAAQQLVAAARELAEAHGLDPELRVAELLALPGVARFVERELDAVGLAAAVERAFDEAIEAVDAMRAREGETLEAEVRSRLDAVGQLVDAIEVRAGTVVEAVREKLRRRVEKLEVETGLVDEARLHQEIVIAADRLDITEEVVRLRSHIEQFTGVLDGSGPGVAVGRQLDFLLQEMGRETNTIGSKANDAEIAHGVVDLKTELERIREQVQNIE
jgi:uncharacterized protein (TIGR00255 family)